MTLSRRGLLAGLAVVLLAAGCTASVHGAPQPVPSPTPHRTGSPERIEFRLVVTDGTGGITLDDGEGTPYILGDMVMNGSAVDSAQPVLEPQSGAWVVMVRLTSTGAAKFGQLTSAHVNEQVAIVVDDIVVSAPRIQAPITGGTVQIAGSLTRDEAVDLANSINGRR